MLFTLELGIEFGLQIFIRQLP